ncbi:DUF4197 domain-containing protein [Flaviaesturariibacter amylovorans]|uniref:DUF4197 domain-containing protein n=1 Tax=Flaviaesturariibacter amylovorans TaxID=1084520 RepID=A0ABP8GYC6_9BACT
MKKILLLALGACALNAANAQFKGMLEKATQQVAKKDTAKAASGNPLGKIVSAATGGSASGLSNEDIISGLKEALAVGTTNGANKLSAVDGFFKDAALKILMPAEAQKVEKTLRGMGMGKQVDQAILSMNRAAEDATKSAAPIFLNAIKGITIQDGFNILKGNETAATTFLKDRTQAQLTAAFRPVIEEALKKVDATKYWNTLFTNYNRFSAQKVNPDLTAYVTEKALFGIFTKVGEEEARIRKDPMARTSDILKKVFGK